MKLVKIGKPTGGYIKTTRIHYRMRNGEELRYTVVGRHAPHTPEDLRGYISGVVALVVDPLGRLLMTQEFRPAVNSRVRGLPTGMVDRGETFAAAAVREVKEECGIRHARVRAVSAPVYINPCNSGEQMVFVFCTTAKVQPVRASDSPREEVNGEWISLSWLQHHLDRWLWAGPSDGIQLSAIATMGIQMALERKETRHETYNEREL